MPSPTMSVPRGAAVLLKGGLDLRVRRDYIGGEGRGLRGRDADVQVDAVVGRLLALHVADGVEL